MGFSRQYAEDDSPWIFSLLSLTGSFKLDILHRKQNASRPPLQPGPHGNIPEPVGHGNPNVRVNSWSNEATGEHIHLSISEYRASVLDWYASWYFVGLSHLTFQAVDEVDVHQANYGFLFNESLRTTRQLAVCKSKRGDVVGAEEVCQVLRTTTGRFRKIPFRLQITHSYGTKKTHGAYVVVWTMLLLVSEIEYSGPFCSDLNLFNLLASCAIKSYCGDGKLKTMFYSRRRNAKHESAQATVRKCSHEALCFQGFSRCNSICVVHAEPSPGIFSIQGLPRPTKKSVHHNNSSANLGPRNSAQRGCENNVDQNQGAELEYSFPCQCERCALVVHAKAGSIILTTRF